METIRETWFINIDERTERRTRFETRFNHLGSKLSLQRYSAVTPWKDPRVGLLKETRAKNLELGAIGCMLSHYDLWNKCLKSGRMLIHEDDLIFRKDYLEILDREIKNLDSKHTSQGWDIFHLNPYFPKAPLEVKPGEKGKACPLTGLTWSVGAYVINPSAAKYLVDYLRLPLLGEKTVPEGPPLEVLDRMISWLFTIRPGKSLSYYPYPCIQDKLGTDIQIVDSQKDHDFYYNKYEHRDLYDWTATEGEFEKPLSELIK